MRISLFNDTVHDDEFIRKQMKYLIREERETVRKKEQSCIQFKEVG